ncbi:hypothetical protein ABW19_dt0201560 [Dactylella cylindrospora]|nr:hypothetical protein ABW19_dt0201560 [Dactylella cylindrospora]
MSEPDCPESPTASLSSLPLDLKVEILRRVTSYEDLISLLLTCRDFYCISKLGSQLWRDIQLSALAREITPSMKALAHIKRCAKDPKAIQYQGIKNPTEVQPPKTIPPNIDAVWDYWVDRTAGGFFGVERRASHLTTKGRKARLADVLQYRSVVRWFADAFLTTKFEIQVGSENMPPGKPYFSDAERLRVQDAMYILWFLTEQWYELILDGLAAPQVLGFWSDQPMYSRLRLDIP